MKVLARIELLSTAKGGRSQPLIGSFRPNHRFEPNMFVIGQVEQDAGDPLFPGQSADLVVQFLPEGLPKLTPGREWEIYDGPRHLIGFARVLRVLET